MIELLFLKKLMLIRQANQKSATFVTNGIFLKNGFKFQPDVCNGCHHLLMMLTNLSDIAILNIKSAYYHCIISGSSKCEVINLMQNIDLTKKSRTL